jgi:hypothetical protein
MKPAQAAVNTAAIESPALRLIEAQGTSQLLTVLHWIAKSSELHARTAAGKKSTEIFHKFETGLKTSRRTCYCPGTALGCLGTLPGWVKLLMDKRKGITTC